MPANWLPVHSKIRSIIKHHDEVMLLGGAGSSKTWTLTHVVSLRCLLLPGSRHLCLRKRFEHAKVSLWNSIKEMMNAEWPGLYEQLHANRSGGSWVLTFPNGSEIHVGGMDDKERIEKWLGSEWATIYINEASEVSEEKDVELISSRLRQKIKGRHLLLLDENPPAKSHWSYERYLQKQAKGRTFFKINPIDVEENLPSSYIERLKNLPERLRQRFLHGEFTSDIEGALWTWEMIQSTRHQLSGEEGRTIIAVDPAVSNNEHSDETGIIAVCVKGDGFKVLADHSLKGTPQQWARAVVDAYSWHQADAIVAEVNQGGDLVTEVLKHYDPDANIRTVRASKGKHVRAEPISALYEQGRVEHADGLGDLEDQLLSWVPFSGDKSPDRLDALVWGLTYLTGKSGNVNLSFV